MKQKPTLTKKMIEKSARAAMKAQRDLYYGKTIKAWAVVLKGKIMYIADDSEEMLIYKRKRDAEEAKVYQYKSEVIQVEIKLIQKKKPIFICSNKQPLR